MQNRIYTSKRRSWSLHSDAEMASQSDLHPDTVEDFVRSYKCKECSQAFPLLRLLNEHSCHSKNNELYNNQVPSKTPTAVPCPEEYSPVQNTSSVPLTCHVCGRIFKHLGRLKRHSEIHTENNKLSLSQEYSDNLKHISGIVQETNKHVQRIVRDTRLNMVDRHNHKHHRTLPYSGREQKAKIEFIAIDEVTRNQSDAVDDSVRSYRCKECHEAFSLLRLLNEHLCLGNKSESYSYQLPETSRFKTHSATQ